MLLRLRIRFRQILRDLEKQVKKLCDALEDTLIFITADHGHMDSKRVAIQECPELLECLERMPSIEPRALNLYVKDGKKEFFETGEEKEYFIGVHAGMTEDEMRIPLIVVEKKK